MRDSTVIALAVTVGAVAVAGAATFAVLARIGSTWRATSEEWWPDEVGSPEE